MHRLYYLLFQLSSLTGCNRGTLASSASFYPSVSRLSCLIKPVLKCQTGSFKHLLILFVHFSLPLRPLPFSLFSIFHIFLSSSFSSLPPLLSAYPVGIVVLFLFTCLYFPPSHLSHPGLLTPVHNCQTWH